LIKITNISKAIGQKKLVIEKGSWPTHESKEICKVHEEQIFNKRKRLTISACEDQCSGLTSILSSELKEPLIYVAATELGIIEFK